MISDNDSDREIVLFSSLSSRFGFVLSMNVIVLYLY